MSSPTRPHALLRHAAALGSVLAGILLASASAHALTPQSCDKDDQPNGGPCFGLEMTFTDDDGGLLRKEVDYGPAHIAAATRWLAAIKEQCPQLKPATGAKCWTESIERDSPCAPTPSWSASPDENGFRVCFAPGSSGSATKTWYYEVTFDPAVLEIKTRPSNQAWLEALQPLFKNAIWDIAGAASLRPEPTLGGGQMHVDLQSGFKSAKHALNFVTSIENLRMLPLDANLGTMGQEAPPLSISGKPMRDLYRAFVDASYDTIDFTTLVTELPKRVYAYSYGNSMWTKAVDYDETTAKSPDNWRTNDRQKYQHVAFHKDKGTIELRNIDTQLDPTEVITIVKLIRRLIDMTPDTAKVSLAAEAQIELDGTADDMLELTYRRKFFTRSVVDGALKLKDSEAQAIVADLRRWLAGGTQASSPDGDAFLCAIPMHFLATQLQPYVKQACAR